MSDRTYLDHMWFSGRTGTWITELRTGSETAMAPVSSLVGKTVNIGDKDGGVHEGAVITAFDERTGYLTLEGGVHGQSFRPDDARPLTGPARLWAHDVARGYVHQEEDL